MSGDPVIVRGRPDDEELAALTVVLAALGRKAAATRRPAAVRPPPSWVWQAEFLSPAWHPPDVARRGCSPPSDVVRW